MTAAPPGRAPFLVAAECDLADDATDEIWRSLAVRLESALLGIRREATSERSDARSLVVTSIDTAVPAAACRLAVAMAALDLPTCLVDAAARFTDKASGEDGLSAWFAEGSASGVRLTKTDVAHLTIVRGETRRREIANALRIDRVRGLTEMLSDRCRRIVWAGPPLASADGMAVAGGVDGVLLVVAPGRLTRDAVRRARVAVASVRGNLLGTVLSDK